MPSVPRPEDDLILLFLSGYDGHRWEDSILDWADQREDGAVDAIATLDDGRTLAIEHTLIEAFIGERADWVRFQPFLRMQDDPSLGVPDRMVRLDLPRGVVDGRNRETCEQIVEALHQWLGVHVHDLPVGEAIHNCRLELGVEPAVVIELRSYVIESAGIPAHPPRICRYGPMNVAETVEKALRTKLPKLVGTVADERILLLERNQLGLNELEIHRAIAEHASAFPELAQVAVWVVDTAETLPGSWEGYVEFKRTVGGVRYETLSFFDGRPMLNMKFTPATS